MKNIFDRKISICRIFASLICVILLCMTVFSGCRKKDDTQPQTEKVYRYNDNIVVDGINRTYIVNLPPNYFEGSGFSLVLAFHGGGGSGSQFETSSLLTQKANASGFIVVYPDGLAGGTLNAATWDAGGCCGYAAAHHIDDVNFVRQLIAKLIAQFNINPKKVYATGHSNGGMLCYRLACELSDKIAAIAPNSTTMVVTTPCSPSRPVPILHMHSALDNNVPYMGGYGTGISNSWMPALDSVFAVWSAINSCSTQGATIISNSSFTEKQWSGCTVNPGIQFYLTADGGHAWPGGLPGSASGDTPSTAINANDLLWDFFQHYQLP